jgi:hypothetical protein
MLDTRVRSALPLWLTAPASSAARATAASHSGVGAAGPLGARHVVA